jgi:hypothetical protein
MFITAMNAVNNSMIPKRIIQPVINLIRSSFRRLRFRSFAFKSIIQNTFIYKKRAAPPLRAESDLYIMKAMLPVPHV